MIKLSEHKKKYIVVCRQKTIRQIRSCPRYIQEKFWHLVNDLEEKGAIQKGWSNFSKLDKDIYHCHLDYSWVAVWIWRKGTLEVEVSYVGSREKAPY